MASALAQDEHAAHYQCTVGYITHDGSALCLPYSVQLEAAGPPTLKEEGVPWNTSYCTSHGPSLWNVLGQVALKGGWQSKHPPHHFG